MEIILYLYKHNLKSFYGAFIKNSDVVSGQKDNIVG